MSPYLGVKLMSLILHFIKLDIHPFIPKFGNHILG